MGVDTSVSVGVGFVIDADTFSKYRETIPDNENYADEELLDLLTQSDTNQLLTCGTGGSYYSNDAITHWIAVERLTTSHDTYDIPGGVVGLAKVTITLAEREALNEIAKKLGIESPIIGHFMSVLWH